MQGMAGMRSSLKYTVTGLDQFQVQPTATGTPTWLPLGLPSGGTNYIEISDFQTQQGRGIGGVEGPAEGLFALGGHNFGSGWPYGSSIKGLNTGRRIGAGKLSLLQRQRCHFYTGAAGTNAPRQFGFRSDPGRSEHGDVTITLSTQPLPGDPTPSVTVQTIHLNVPAGTFQIPDVTTTDWHEHV